MKNLLIAASLLLSTASFGSAFQIDCSNATGQIKVSSGHFSNKIILTEYVSPAVNNSVEYEPRATPVENLTVDTVLETISFNTCDDGSVGGGMAQSESWYSKKVSITKEDGTLFPSNTIGINEDGTAVEAWLICKSFMNSRVPCN